MHLLSCIPKTVFKKDKIEIDYFDKFRCLHLSWEGGITREEAILAQTEMLRLTQKYPVEFWVFDAREQEHLNHFDPNWTIDFYSKEVPKHPVKKIARIASGNFNDETHLSAFITKLLKENNIPFEFRYLADTNEALAWFMDGENPESGKC